MLVLMIRDYDNGCELQLKTGKRYYVRHRAGLALIAVGYAEESLEKAAREQAAQTATVKRGVNR